MLENKIVAVDSLVFLQVSLPIQINGIMHKFSDVNQNRICIVLYRTENVPVYFFHASNA